MKSSILTLGIVACLSGCTQEVAQPEAKNPVATNPTAAPPEKRQDAEPSPPTETAPAQTASRPQSEEAPADESLAVEPFSKEQQQKLLAARLEGGMQYSFRQFANMFLVSSRLRFGVGIGLMTSSREIANTELQSPFPRFYEPTLREFLDAVALQTFAEWNYDPTTKYVKSSVKSPGPIKELAIFEFTKTHREKPFTVTLADGWKSEDKGHWLMLIPPSFPVGMDIYEMGTYSADAAEDQADLLQKVRSEVAVEWAKRVHPEAEAEDMHPARVGDYEALYFETMVPSQLKKDLRWRQWVFMVDDKCYFIVSTILPEFDDEIFSDVEQMLASFRAGGPPVAEPN